MGLGSNKLIAKIASDFRKPDGLTAVRPEKVHDFLDPLSIRVIPGVGPKTELFLHGRGIRSIAELRAAGAAQLGEWFGKWGQELYLRACGISESPVTNAWEPKSIGEQETFEEDTLDPAFILDRARLMAGSVFHRLLAAGFRAFRTVTITVRFADFVTTSRSQTAKAPLMVQEQLESRACHPLLPFLDARENPTRKKLRLIGVRVEELVREDQRGEARELMLFEEGTPD